MKRAELDRLLANSHDNEKALDHLNEREFEMFSLLAQGSPAFIISREMGVSGDELNSIKSQIRKKLGLKDDVQLLQYAAKHRP